MERRVSGAISKSGTNQEANRSIKYGIESLQMIHAVMSRTAEEMDMVRNADKCVNSPVNNISRKVVRITAIGFSAVTMSTDVLTGGGNRTGDRNIQRSKIKFNALPISL